MHKLEYNSQRKQIIIPEHGRNFQKIVEWACTVENREERNKIAKEMIHLLGQLNPMYRDVEEYKHLLWDHLFIISDYKLDVDSPYPIPNKTDLMKKPDSVAYPHQDIKIKQYGRHVQEMIKYAVSLEEGDEKKYLVQTIANLMKKQYLTWNRDSVNDAVIFQHLEQLSGGKLKLPADFALEGTSEILSRNNAFPNSTGMKSKSNSNNNGRRNNRNLKFNKNRKKF